MVKLVAHQSLATSILGLDYITGTNFSTFRYSGPGDDTPDFIKYFDDPNLSVLKLTLHGGLSDLVIAAAIPDTMTVTEIDAKYQGKAYYELTGTSFELHDYYDDNWDDIENVIFAGNDRIFGSPGKDYLFGLDGDDVIKGGKGRDLIAGGTGLNTLTGGKGPDAFGFAELEPSSLVDHVVDFEEGRDQLVVAGMDFDMLRYGPDGTLKGGMFHLGRNAEDGNDHLIYHQKSGTLFFDADGAGGLSKWKLAIFDNKPELSHHDFYPFIT